MDDEFDDAIEKVDESILSEMLGIACELLALVHNDGRTATNVMYDLLESTSFESVKNKIYEDYSRIAKR